MSTFWSMFIIGFTLANIVGLMWLLFATARRRPNEKSEDTTGHVWDEDIREYNKPLPRWWLGLFVLTVIFGLGYLVLYPGLGVYAGILNWTSVNEQRDEVKINQQKLEMVFAQFRNRPITELMHDDQALHLGQNVFANNCIACHGSDAHGAKGYPNLVDNDWLYGGDSDNVLTTILDGHQGVMPPLGAVLGDAGVNEVAQYVLSLSGQKTDPSLTEAGKARYTGICIACHGPEAKGNPVVGAPNLTDSIWLYGGTLEEVKASIRDGRNGKMPAWRNVLGEDRARLVAAWVLAQNQTTRSTKPQP